MTAKVNSIGWHRNNVANASFDVPVTAGAEVRLHSLVWLHKAGFSVGPEVDSDSLSHTRTVCRGRGRSRMDAQAAEVPVCSQRIR